MQYDAKHHIDQLIQTTEARYLHNRKIPSTPLLLHERLSDDLGTPIYIKREDALDTIGSGHKHRKLSYIVAEALHNKANVLITIGSLPSNQCKAVASIAIQHKMRAHVIYTGDHQARPKIAQGNYFLTSLLDPTLTWYENTLWQNADKCINDVVHQEQLNGAIPYIVPSGASSWPGILGSIELGIELAHQLQSNSIDAVDIVLPAGSGGTCLGLQIASEILGLNWQIHGICIGGSSESLSSNISQMKFDLLNKIPSITKSIMNLHFHDKFLGSGYDLPTVNELNEMQTSFRNYNLLLDPNYMLKAYLGLKSLINNNIIGTNKPVILVHTGGQFGLFDNGPQLQEWFISKYKNWIKD